MLQSHASNVEFVNSDEVEKKQLSDFQDIFLERPEVLHEPSVG